MNRLETKEDFFAFEKEGRKFFDAYYARRGWICQRIFGKENARYDCLVLIGSKKVRIQEKVRSREYPDCLVELVQDINTGDRGWLYTCEADYILYKTPDSFYWINRPMLKKHMAEHGGEYDTRESRKGWGWTLNAVVPWSVIIGSKIGGKIDKDFA